MARNKTSHKTLEFVEPRPTTSRPRGYPRRSQTRGESYNATKAGIFGPILLVEEESVEFYEVLLQDFVRDLNPIGTVEFALVEKLATNIWRQRRLIQAERAEISETATSNWIAIHNTARAEEWDVIRQGREILRNCSNPFVLQHAITRLKDCRESLEKNGFQPSLGWQMTL